jgi:hypothetical protein
MNKAISETILRKWYEHCKPYLDCESANRIMVEKEYKKTAIASPFLLPHEFLFLMCNCEDRLLMIKRVH